MTTVRTKRLSTETQCHCVKRFLWIMGIMMANGCMVDCGKAPCSTYSETSNESLVLSLNITENPENENVYEVDLQSYIDASENATFTLENVDNSTVDIRLSEHKLIVQTPLVNETRVTLQCSYFDTATDTQSHVKIYLILINHWNGNPVAQVTSFENNGSRPSDVNPTRTDPAEIGKISAEIENRNRKIRRQLSHGSLAQNTISSNDKPPTFIHPDCRPFGGICADVEYTIHVQPGIVPGIQPLQVQPRAIEARDAEFAKAVTYKFINGTPSNYETYFFMDPSSGSISQLRPVPHDTTDSYLIHFMAQEAGPSTLYSIAKLIVHVDNAAENLHDPVLEASGLQGYIEENSEMGTHVRTAAATDSLPLQILVTDGDLKPGMAPATYQYILMGIGASVFAVNQGGYVYLNVPNLDADGPSPKTYALTIQAREVGTTPIRTSQAVSIKINVIDLNDNEPTFERQVYQATAAADEIMQDILKVKAKDGDSGEFGELTYSIVSVTNNGEPFFRYNKDTHTIVAIAPLDVGDQYQILLQAMDGARRTGQAVIVVDVVATTTAPLTTTTTVTTTLATTTTAPLYSKAAAAKETSPLFPLMPAFSQLPVSVSYNVTVGESTPPDTAILRLGAEGHSNVRYSIVSGNEEKKFSIDTETGTVSTVTAFDRERTSFYRLAIRVAGPSINDSVGIVIEVSDENDNAPVFLNSKPISFVVEEGKADAFVGHLKADDADAGLNGMVTLSIDPSSPSAGLFKLDSKDGALRTKVALQGGENALYQLKIIAKDKGSPPQESFAEVSVRVVRKEALLPYFTNDNYVIEIDENAGARDLVTVEAVSPTGKETLEYILKQGDPTLFAVHSATGIVSTLANLDAEQRRTHSLIVGTKQNNEQIPGSTVNIEVRVKDVNDMVPVFQPQTYAAALIDTSPVGTPVLQVTATDPDVEDANRMVKYRLAGYANATQYFAIDPVTGLITVARPLQKIKIFEFTLLVEAKDNGSPAHTSTATVAVQIQHLNHANTAAVEPAMSGRDPSAGVPTETTGRIKFSMQQYSIDIAENADAASFLQVLPVENKPASLIGLQCNVIAGNYGGVFSVIANGEGNCELRLRGVLDRETVDRYTLNVSVSSPGLNGRAQMDFCNVLVQVTDINDNAPRFIFDTDTTGNHKVYLTAISPEKPPFSLILTVKAQDADADDNSKITYSISSDDADSQYFAINPGTGEIKNIKMLGSVLTERDPTAPFEFSVEARDNPSNQEGQPLTATADVAVNTIAESNRFVMTLDGVSPSVLERYIPDIKKAMTSRIGDCKVLGVESMAELTDEFETPGTDVTWYAINPVTKKICRHAELDMLFEKSNVDYIKGELSGWLSLRNIRRTPAGSVMAADTSAGLFSHDKWQAAEIALIILACVIVVGAIGGIFAMCYFWARYKAAARIMPTDRVQLYSALPKYNALVLPPSEKEYETQIMELAVPAESANGKAIEGDFSVEEGIYNIQSGGKLDIFAQRQPPSHVYIPPPDYPVANGLAGFTNGSTLHACYDAKNKAPPAPSQRKRNSEKTTIL